MSVTLRNEPIAYERFTGCQAQDNAIPLALSNSIPVIVKSILFGHAHCLMRGARKAVGVPVPRSNCLSSF